MQKWTLWCNTSWVWHISYEGQMNLWGGGQITLFFRTKKMSTNSLRVYNSVLHTPGTSQLSGQTGKNPLPHHESYVKIALALNARLASCSNFPKLSFGKLRVISSPFLGYGNSHKSSMLILIEKVSKLGEIFFSLFG